MTTRAGAGRWSSSPRGCVRGVCPARQAHLELRGQLRLPLPVSVIIGDNRYGRHDIR